MPQLTHKFIAVDQYGNHVWIKSHPRKELMATCGCKKASKIYIDAVNGQSHHVGYAVAGRWFDVFRVLPMNED